jgi:hypothetical protein
MVGFAEWTHNNWFSNEGKYWTHKVKPQYETGIKTTQELLTEYLKLKGIQK